MNKLKAQRLRLKAKKEKNNKAFRHYGGNFGRRVGHPVTFCALGPTKGAGRSPGPSIFDIFVGSALLYRYPEGNLMYRLYGGQGAGSLWGDV